MLLYVQIHITTGRKYVLTALMPTTGHVTTVSFHTFLLPTARGDHGHPARSGGVVICPEPRAGICRPLDIIGGPLSVRQAPSPQPLSLPGEPQASPALVILPPESCLAQGR